MLRVISLPSALVVSSLVLLGCPADEPALDGGINDAGTVDAGNGNGGEDAGQSGCGDISAEGECEENVVAFCDTVNDEVISYDCGDRALFPNATTQCVEVTEDYGVDCTVAPGEECAYFDDDGEFVWVLCRGTEPACLETADAFECTENAGTCDDTDIDTCDGDTLTWSCAASQPFLIDCATYGGSCSAAAGACVDLPAGQICDDELYQCAAGLDCQEGVCVTVGEDDAGTSDDDAGTEADAGANTDAG